MNILAVEPFYSGSHKAFWNGLQQHSAHRIIPVNLSFKGQNWRMHGHSVMLAGMVGEVEEQIDLLLISSMANLPAFLALTNPRFAAIPKVVYMHENPFTQPVPEEEERDLTYCYINYLSMLAADRLIFSSHFHQRDILRALPDFLENYPDDRHYATVQDIAEKSEVIYPGLDLHRFDEQPDTRKSNKNPVIVWNQRWQFDRNPAMFFRVLNRLDDIDLEFDLILAGDSQHEKPEEFEKAWQRYGRHISHFGYVENKENYGKLLHRGDIVISTATYEFFCVAIMEAIYCGCHPLLPKRLHYPELVPDHLHYPLLHAPVLYDTEDDLFHYLKDLLTHEVQPLPKTSLQKINNHLDWSNRINKFDAMFEEFAEIEIKSAL